MIKKLSFTVLAFVSFLMIFQTVYVASADAPKVSVEVPNGVIPGDTISVRISLDSNPGLAGLQLEIAYDSNVLRLEHPDRVTRGSALSSLMFGGVNAETYQNNPFKVSWVGAANDRSDGVILNIQFTVLSNAKSGASPITVSYVPNNTRNQNGSLIELNTVNGSVIVMGADTPNTQVITVSAGVGGSVSGGGVYDQGTAVTLIATPNTGYSFDGWYENNVKIVSAELTYTFVSSSDRSLEARFNPIGGNVPPLGDSTSQSSEDPLSQTSGGSQVSKVSETDVNSAEMPQSGYWSNPFNDVNPSDWFYDAVRFAFTTKLMKGMSDTMFSPGLDMSRAMLVTVLYRLEGEPTVSGNPSFTDVKSGEWYTNAIIWASQNSIVFGYSSEVFGLNDSVTREQVVSILYRYAGFKQKDVSASTDLSGFSDLSDVSEWALSAMKWAVEEKIIQGRTDLAIEPQGTATRAEVATILKRYIENFLDEEGE